MTRLAVFHDDEVIVLGDLASCNNDILIDLAANVNLET